MVYISNLLYLLNLTFSLKKGPQSFDGTWYGQANGELLATIQGNILTWKNGARDELVYGKWGKIATVIDHEGKKWSAKLASSGSLQWNDGNVWVKQIAGKFQILF